MKNDMDQLLKTALAPADVPDEYLNGQVLRKAKEREAMAKRKKHYKRFPAAVVLAACILVLGSVTAVAAYRYLSPAQAAEEAGDDLLKEAFMGEDAVLVNETQESGGYRITLLGSVAGKNISRFIAEDGSGVPADDRIYTVVAIEHGDGTPMPESGSDEYLKEAFYVSHYIRGLDPNRYSMMSLGGGYTEFVKDGILYRLIEMDNIEMFADRGIYVGVNTGTFYDADAYRYDAGTGEMHRNESYQGINALFELPMDKSKADPAAAAAYLEEFERSLNAPSEPVEMDASDMEVDAFVDMLTSDNLEKYCEMIESTKQVCTPDKDGCIAYGYDLGDEGAGSGEIPVDEIFPDGKTGVWNIKGCSYSNGIEDLLIDAFVLNEDGTVTYALYRPKQ